MRIKLPEKHSVKWFYIAGVLSILTFIILIAFSRLSGINLGMQNIIGFVLLSVIITAVISSGGFLGAKIYFRTSLIFYIIAAVYMLYIAVSRTVEGWTDLVGIISYIFIIAAGFAAGIILQGIIFLLSKTKNK
ncbi:MAG: hypothetical protein ACYCWE_17390 [Eubacteriales bacterium]